MKEDLRRFLERKLKPDEYEQALLIDQGRIEPEADQDSFEHIRLSPYQMKTLRNNGIPDIPALERISYSMLLSMTGFGQLHATSIRTALESIGKSLAPEAAESRDGRFSQTMPFTEFAKREGMSERTLAPLIRAGIRTPGMLEERSERDLLLLPNFGRQELKELTGILSTYGLQLKHR